MIWNFPGRGAAVLGDRYPKRNTPQFVGLRGAPNEGEPISRLINRKIQTVLYASVHTTIHISKLNQKFTKTSSDKGSFTAVSGLANQAVDNFLSRG
ncbi:MAG: hypothetical protein JNL84_00195 [Candidatus Accumulibacter sp.]|nr:hypothetical protein [Accumulibacter sp.]